jgi:hypothetical protein
VTTRTAPASVGLSLALAAALAIAACGGGSSGSRSAATTRAASVPKDAITGFGATNGAWDAHHTSDRKYAPGAVYNPDPSAPSGAQYDGVLHEAGRVLQYDLRFPNESITSAKAKVAQELPPDAHRVAFSVKDTCAFELFRSAKLGRALATIGDRS